MSLKDRLDVKNISILSDFDRYEGSRRTEIKAYDRTIEYRGFQIKRNSYIPVGAEGYWEVPDLKFLDLGGIKTGFLTVSITQSKDAIDKWFELNIGIAHKDIVH